MQIKPHEGRNVKRIREILGIKQDTLAIDLGLSQQAISSLEQKETLDVLILEKVAGALGIKPDLIKNFVPEDAIYNIQNNYEGSNQGATHINTNNTYCTINYSEKFLESVEENKKLYERLLQVEREKNELLQQWIDEIK